MFLVKKEKTVSLNISTLSDIETAWAENKTFNSSSLPVPMNNSRYYCCYIF